MAKIARKVCALPALSLIVLTGAFGNSCGNPGSRAGAAEITEDTAVAVGNFDADSAFAYVKKQVEFGPRVPNTDSHARCSEWLSSELEKRGGSVEVQRASLRAFDGTMLDARNIYARFNPEAQDRVLLMAHWDTRPWADSDPDEQLRRKPSDGANDGASGVGVLLEIARQLSMKTPSIGVDILFVDAEDWGAHDNDESWALGAQYFVSTPPSSYTTPREVVLLDMVGGRDARFAREYFSQSYAPSTVQRVWGAAAKAGYSQYFVDIAGGGVTDDHVQFIKANIPAIDIIEYDSESGTGFNPVWHTSADNLDNISSATLKAVGQTLMYYIYMP